VAAPARVSQLPGISGDDELYQGGFYHEGCQHPSRIFDKIEVNVMQFTLCSPQPFHTKDG
jgi:hypothetical protein